MRHRWLAALSALVAIAPFIIPVKAADSGVELIGFGLVPGDALDKSGLKSKEICSLDRPEDCISQATLGGQGSAIAYTGFDNVFLMLPDRGPFDGRTDVPYSDRFHLVRFTIAGAKFTYPSKPNIKTDLLATRFMRTAAGDKFVGSSSNFEMRLDPEGVSVSRLGNFYVSDEYGPYINEFNRQGVLVRRISVPDKFLIANPSGDIDAAGNSLELYPANNTSGRQANRGMEGLAITPDGRYLVGTMQNSLLQDHALNANSPPGRIGLVNRILKVDLITGNTWEYAYVVEKTSNGNPGNGRGVNDILAVNDHEFLVIERDNISNVPTPGSGNAPANPVLKTIYKIDLDGATDVSSKDSLPRTGDELPAANITPVTKEVFINLLDNAYVVDTSVTPATIKSVVAEKVEGLAWGPDLKDGRHVLYVVTDNDLFAGNDTSPALPTQIYAFAIDAGKADFERQQIQVRMYLGDDQ